MSPVLMLRFLIVQIQVLLSAISSFIFLGSKSILSSRNKLFTCGVREIQDEEFALTGRVFYPAKRSLLPTPNVEWFSCSVSDMLHGKMRYFFVPCTRSRIIDILIRIIVLLAKFIPKSCLPRLPNTSAGGDLIQLAETDEPLPLILWSHGRAGNVHDHALMLSQFAVEIPAIVVAVTHTDSSADAWKDSRKQPAFFRPSVRSGPPGDDRYIQELVNWNEYQVKYRIDELERAAQYVQEKLGFKFGKIIIGGFDLGGAVAVSVAARMHSNGDATSGIKPAGAISLDGTFAVEEQVPFPKHVFEASSAPIKTPTAFLLSDEWQVWNRVMTDNTRILMERTERPKLITVKQTKHLSFIESMYWVPQILVILLRITGVIHRRGSPRKTYRRTVKWLIALIQQYVATEKAFPPTCNEDHL